MSSESESADWARKHEASFEADPIIEMKGAQKVQAGFVLNLYARIPMEIPPGDERGKAAKALWGRLREILDQALGGEDQRAEVRVEVDPMRTAAVLRPANEMKPEITLRARVQHAEAFQAVTADERQRMSAFEKKLVALGLRAGHW